MLFNSIEFLVFFVSVVLLYIIASQDKNKKIVLFLSSCLFYMWWNPYYIFLILASTMVDYMLGRKMYEESDIGRRRMYLFLSMVFNLGVLSFFKYFNFFQDNCLWMLRQFGYDPSWSTLNIILPVGISFYTFQTMSYTIDIYRGELKPAKSLLDFATFVAFFPQLVAGPIIRAKDFMPQLDILRPVKFSERELYRILRGLVKKVVIADNLGMFVDTIYATPDAYPSIIIWMATIAFTIQIYCDFSGYTDIAIGLAAILGFNFPPNFNRPYFSRTPSEFWRKWHISLSGWLRDYLYISLGGNRNGKWLTYRNLMITMLLGGLWHGAGWNFVLWGFLHGAILVLYRITKLDKIIFNASFICQVLAGVVMQYMVWITWITFRQTDKDLMLMTLKKFLIFDFQFGLSSIGLGKLNFFTVFILITSFVVIHIYSRIKGGLDEALLGYPQAVKAGVLLLSGLVLFYFWPTKETPFIYFQF